MTSRRKTIPGVMDASALAALSADRPSVWRSPAPDNAAALAAVFGEADPATVNAPRTRPEFRKACRDLVARGYSTRDTAHALRLTVTSVLELLGEAEPIDPLARFKR